MAEPKDCHEIIFNILPTLHREDENEKLAIET